MTDEAGYNGWKNYETWCMALWIDNDRASYEYSREIVSTALAENRSDDEWQVRSAAGIAADMLKEWQYEEMPDLPASVWSDLLNAAFGAVDWYEIAANYLSELADA